MNILYINISFYLVKAQLFMEVDYGHYGKNVLFSQNSDFETQNSDFSS